MEIKKAIHTLEYLIEDYKEFGNNRMASNIAGVLSLLNEGEAYRQMWEEICRHYALMEFDKEGYEKGIKNHIELEQKYFPKGGEKSK